MADTISLKDYSFENLKKYPNVGYNRKKELVEFSYNGNANLRPSGCKLALTKEAKEEYEKCRDFEYFVNNYVVVFVSGKGFTNITLRDYQLEISETVDKEKKILLMAGRRMGKCVHPETDITIRNKHTGEIETISFEEFDAMN